MLELISYVLILSVVRTQLHVTPAFPTSETVPVPSTEPRHTTSQGKTDRQMYRQTNK